MMENSKESWKCGNCGKKNHDSIVCNGIEIDVTCETVYIVEVDGNGFGFDHDEFEKIIEHYNKASK